MKAKIRKVEFMAVRDAKLHSDLLQSYKEITFDSSVFSAERALISASVEFFSLWSMT